MRRFVDDDQTAADERAFDECMHPTSSTTAARRGSRPAGAPGQFEGFRAAFPDFRATILDQIAEGDKVVTRKVFNGTHLGLFQGIAPTGREVEIHVIDIVRVADDRIVDHWNCVDLLGLCRNSERCRTHRPPRPDRDGAGTLTRRAGSSVVNRRSGPLRPAAALHRRAREPWRRALIVVPPQLEATVTAIGHPFMLGAEPPADTLAALWERLSTASHEEAAILGNRELFGRLWTTAMLPAAERACRAVRPDLVLHEAAEYAGAIAAERCGVAHAQVAISLAEVEADALDLAAPAWRSTGERIVERLRASPYLTRFPASLDPSPFAATRRFREPADAARCAAPGPVGGSDAPLIYVTFGSVVGGLPNGVAVYRTALEAVAGLRARVLLTVGRAYDIDALGPVPPNAHVEAWVPQAEVLREAGLVVAHGGRERRSARWPPACRW